MVGSNRAREALGIGRNRWSRIKAHIPHHVIEENVLYASTHNVLPFYTMTELAMLRGVCTNTIWRLLKRKGAVVYRVRKKGIVGVCEIVRVM